MDFATLGTAAALYYAGRMFRRMLAVKKSKKHEAACIRQKYAGAFATVGRQAARCADTSGFRSHGLLVLAFARASTIRNR
jgi:hypothetical protein